MATDSFGFDNNLFDTWQNPSSAFKLSAHPSRVKNLYNPNAPSNFTYSGTAVDQALDPVPGSPLSYLSPTAELDATAPVGKKSHVTSYDKMMENAGPYSDGTSASQVNSHISTPNSDTGILGSAGSAIGAKGWGDGLSDGDIYKDASGNYMKSGFFTDSAAKLGDFSSLEDANKAGLGLGLTADQFRASQADQARLNHEHLAEYGGAIMGAGQLGLGVLSYLDNKAMNKKNSELIDQQIANNQDIMKTRTERAADIKKYFG
jgi:hypothetical protein